MLFKFPNVRRALLATLLICGFFLQVRSQVEVDSIRQLLPGAEGRAKVDLLNTLASRLITISPDEVETITAEALNLAQESGYDSGIIRSWVARATLWSEQSDFTRARKQLLKAEELAINISDLQAQALIKNSLGANFGKQGRYAESIEAYLLGIPLAKESNDLDLAASLLMNIGRTKELLSEFDEATDFYEKASSLYQELGDKFRIGQLYINMGVLEYKKQNLGMSVEYNTRALEIFDALGDKKMTALSLQNLGFASASSGKYQEALDQYSKSYKLREEIKDGYGMGKILLNKARIFESQGRDRTAIESARASIEQARNIDNKILLRDGTLFLFNLLSKQGAYQEALDNFMTYTRVKDTLTLLANQSKVTELTTRYNFDRLTSENQLQVQQNEIKDLKIRQRNQLIIGLLFMFLLLVVIFYNQRKGMRYRLELSKKDQEILKKQTDLANKEVESQKEKLVAYANQVLLKESILAETKSELSELKNGVSAGKSIDELIEGLNTSIYEKDWLAFKLYFEATYPDFFDKLRLRSDEISINDQRMAAMIKIGLSNKEIGSAFNISPDSVVRAKHRLRQKLDFNTPLEMEDFMIKL